MNYENPQPDEVVEMCNSLEQLLGTKFYVCLVGCPGGGVVLSSMEKESVDRMLQLVANRGPGKEEVVVGKDTDGTINEVTMVHDSPVGGALMNNNSNPSPQQIIRMNQAIEAQIGHGRYILLVVEKDQTALYTRFPVEEASKIIQSVASQKPTGSVVVPRDIGN